MDEEFDYNDAEELRFSVERYEEMIRNKDQYFFDAQAFEGIIDYFIEKNDPIKALQVVEYAINQHPYASVFLIRQAQLYVVTNRAHEALNILDRAETLESSNPDIFIIRGSIYEKFEMFDEAISQYNLEIEFAEEVDDIHLHIAYAFENLGRYDKAIEHLKLALEVNPQNMDALYEIAFCFDILDKSEDSINFYLQFIENDPYSFAAWYNLGNAYTKAELFEKSIEAYDYAIIINEAFASAYFNKGNALANLERYAEALSVYKQTMEYEQPSAETFCSIGECYEKS